MVQAGSFHSQPETVRGTPEKWGYGLLPALELELGDALGHDRLDEKHLFGAIARDLFEAVFGALSDSDAFQSAFAAWLDHLWSDGVEATLAGYVSQSG